MTLTVTTSCGSVFSSASLSISASTIATSFPITQSLIVDAKPCERLVPNYYDWIEPSYTLPYEYCSTYTTMNILIHYDYNSYCMESNNNMIYEITSTPLSTGVPVAITTSTSPIYFSTCSGKKCLKVQSAV
jgi:hypothetical protein